MMRKTSAVFGALLGTAILAGLAGAADGQIAVVQMDRLIKAHPTTKENLAVLKKQIKDFEDEQDKMIAERDSLEKTYRDAREEAENKALSEDVRGKKRQAAEDKLAALKELEKKRRETANLRQKQLTDQELRMRETIVSRIRDVIRDYTAKKGIIVVLNGSAGVDGIEAVVYRVDKLDITEDILKLISDESKKDDKP